MSSEQIVETPAFWLAVVLIECAIPMVMPNKRWNGLVMLVVGLLLLASAYGYLPPVSLLLAQIPARWQERAAGALIVVLILLARAYLPRLVARIYARLIEIRRRWMPPNPPMAATVKMTGSVTVTPPKPSDNAIHLRPPDSRPAGPLPTVTPMDRPWTGPDYEPASDDLAIIYGLDAQRKIVRLKFQSDRSNRNEDALFLLLYGYWRLLDMTDVPVVNLNRSLWESGCRKKLHPLIGLGLLSDNALEVADIARGVDQELIQKHGLARGGFYRLTERGLGKAKSLFIYMRDNA